MVERVEFYERVAYQRERTLGVPVFGGSRICGEIERDGGRLEHKAEGATVVRAGFRRGRLMKDGDCKKDSDEQSKKMREPREKVAFVEPGSAGTGESAR